MNGLHQPTIDYYEKHAADLSGLYDKADVSDLWELLAQALPRPGHVLEIGCGSGREACWLASRGWTVTATDASEAMLAGAKKAAADAPIRFEQAAFPLPDKAPLLRERFDAIICVAVLMHVPDNSLFNLVFQMRAMLNPGGRVVCSFCTDREPDPTDPRLYLNRQPDEVRLLFERIGFTFRFRQDAPDHLGRQRSWTTLVFDLDGALGSRPVDQIETLVNRDRKTTTYKLALLRALCDLAQTGYRHVNWHSDGTVSLPRNLISEKWIDYYWPLFDTPDGTAIPQIGGARRLGFDRELAALIDHFAGQNQLSGFHGTRESGRLNKTETALFQSALGKIGQAIVSGPVRYATQGGFRFDATTGRVHFNAGLWREMCLLGHWVSDAILFRWAELCVELSNRQFDAATVLRQLIARPETERDVLDVRKLYREEDHLSCVWTQVSLDRRRFDVDHVIPFSHWHNNDLWNLLPADPKVNNRKRDKLVTRAVLFERGDDIIRNWRFVRSAMPDRFDFEISRTLLGRNFPEAQWEWPALSALAEAVETLAIQRNLERWEPDDIMPAVRTRRCSPAASPTASTTTTPPSARPAGDATAQERLSKKVLPIVGNLAAGAPFDGFETHGLECMEELDWVEVPAELHGKGRFVVRVAGDSMEPLFHIGDLLVFEYHRTPRQNGQIVLAADFSTGGEYAIKRYQADPTHWCFLSENPAYAPIRIPKDEMPASPILGTYVDRLRIDITSPHPSR
jgi:SAM-dependent methyltransferase/SOS-response transcriptional repressor LexA